MLPSPLINAVRVTRIAIFLYIRGRERLRRHNFDNWYNPDPDNPSRLVSTMDESDLDAEQSSFLANLNYVEFPSTRSVTTPFRY